jgi:hypothetical protein
MGSGVLRQTSKCTPRSNGRCSYAAGRDQNREKPVTKAKSSAGRDRQNKRATKKLVKKKKSNRWSGKYLKVNRNTDFAYSSIPRLAKPRWAPQTYWLAH